MAKKQPVKLAVVYPICLTSLWDPTNPMCAGGFTKIEKPSDERKFYSTCTHYARCSVGTMERETAKAKAKQNK